MATLSATMVTRSGDSMICLDEKVKKREILIQTLPVNHNCKSITRDWSDMSGNVSDCLSMPCETIGLIAYAVEYAALLNLPLVYASSIIDEQYHC